VETISEAIGEPRRTKRPTMKDVAALAGVSLATVSRVVNGNAAVDAQLAGRVEHAVKLLGYRRDALASTLRRSDRVSASVGLIFEDVANPFFSAVHRGVEDVARARGVLTFAGSSDDDPARERHLAEEFSARGVDGLLVVPASEDQSYLLRDQDAGVALVFVDRVPRLVSADVVLSDNGGGIETAVAHLVAHGHRRIAFVGDRPRVFTAAERLAGYQRARAAAGIPPDPRLVRMDVADSVRAAAAVLALVADPEPPTAIVAGQNLITIGALRALRVRRMADVVALVGFDDIPLADLVEPGVTVVAQDPASIGRRAAELLFERIRGATGPAREIVVPTRLIARGSGELSPPSAAV
jgi:LacI family transcriptional regulator